MQEPFSKTNPSFLNISKWQNDQIIAGITTRIGGVSISPFDSFNLGLHVKDDKEAILENRSILANKLSIPLTNWVSGQQVHGTNILKVSAHEKGKGAKSHEDALKGIDGLITTDTNILLTAFFADCVPLFFYDPKRKIIGLAHAGWRGTVAGMGPKMIEEFEKLGSDIEDIQIVIGPCISGTNYEVDDNVIDQIPVGKRLMPIVSPTKPGHYLLDLKALHKEMLIEAGISIKNIEMTHYCTYDEQEMFFSHRRDNGKTGRMLAFIGISGN